MGRLTELFDIAGNGIQESERYHWIDPREPDTRELLILMRRKAKTIEQPVLWDE